MFYFLQIPKNKYCSDHLTIVLFVIAFYRLFPDTSQLLTTSNFIGPWYHAALLFSGLRSIVLLFGVLFSQQIREDLVRAATSPFVSALKRAPFHGSVIVQSPGANPIGYASEPETYMR